MPQDSQDVEIHHRCTKHIQFRSPSDLFISCFASDSLTSGGPKLGLSVALPHCKTTMTENTLTKPAVAEGSMVDLMERNVEVVRKLEQAAKQERSTSERIAAVIASFCGSMKFVAVHVLWFGVWIVLNVVPDVKHFDPFPFTFLTLIVSLEAIFLSTFIMISQNYDTRITDRRNHLDLQINLLSEQENTKMIMMLQAIAEKVGAEIENDHELTVMAQETELEKVVEHIDQHAAGDN